MFKNYFKTACRTLINNKLYTILNIAGLCFGLSCFLLIGLYLFDELTFDTQHHNVNRIYRVIENKSVNGESTRVAGAGFQLAEQSPKKIPGVELTTRMQRLGRVNISNPANPSNFFQETVTVADEHLLEIFDFPLLAGDKRTALLEPNSILITEDLAMKLFNKVDVLGKPLQFSFMNSPLVITGILKNHPYNSSFDFTSVMAETSFRKDASFQENIAADWLSDNFSVYVLLKPGARAVAEQVTQLVQENYTAPAGTIFSFSLQPVKDMHLHSEGILDGARNSNVTAMTQGSLLYVKIFSVIAFFMLLIAGINYMKLATARASGRLKEIGVRKTVGARQHNLILQFLLESLLVTLLSFVLALLVVNLLLPFFNTFIHKKLSLGWSTDYRVWLYAFTFVLLTGLLSGTYPALLLSHFRPVLLLKGIKQQTHNHLSLRKGLVIFQFALSVVMMIATMVLFMQVNYLNHADLGLNKNLLVVIDVNTFKARENFEAVKAEMARIPAVQEVSVTSRVPGEWKTMRTLKIKNYGSTHEAKIAYMIGADQQFLKTFQIPLAQGRNFESPTDSSGILLNETAAKMLGVTEAKEQVLEIPEFSGENDGNFERVYKDNTPFTPKVIGIVKDFHFQTLRDKIEPLVICYNQNPIQSIDYYIARISATDIKKTLVLLKQVMVNNDKNDPFEYHFLDEQLAQFYWEDNRRQTMLIWASLASIFIACLGLFGLATYAAGQRVKEIGVRKVLGATLFQLVSLLSKDFLQLVLIAIVIAFPIAWWAVHQWLQEYAYHINVQWWVFAAAGVLAVLLALLTILYQAIKAARSNPVQSLRTE